MPLHYPGRLITATAPSLTNSTSGKGIFSASESAQYKQAGNWAAPPSAPTSVSASAGTSQAAVSFTAPASLNGSTITNYTVTSSPGNFTGTGSSSPITVTGLTNGTTYTFTVVANSNCGSSPASSASSGVTPVTIITADYLVIAGGGGGGGGTTSPGGSGAGAGGYRYFTGFALSPGTPYTVTIGAGGTGGTGTSPIGTKGSDSVFNSSTSTGGGAGQYYQQTFDSSIHSGGSGGGSQWVWGGTGASATQGLGNTPSTSPSQGNNGGLGTGGTSNQAAPGGGGAGGAGGDSPGGSAGVGGAGTLTTMTSQAVTISIATPGVITLTRPIANGSEIKLTTSGSLPTGLTASTSYWVVNSSGSTINLSSTNNGSAIATSGSQSGVHTLTQVMAGGGAGGAGINSTSATGNGGGGNGGSNLPTIGTAGATNTGGGGGGAGENQNGTNSGTAGGSGIVIIRYPVAASTIVSFTGSSTTYTDATYRYYVFTSSGTATW